MQFVLVVFYMPTGPFTNVYKHVGALCNLQWYNIIIDNLYNIGFFRIFTS